MIHRIITFFLLCSFSLMAQQHKEKLDTISGFFTEIQSATKKNTNLWNKDIYGPILLVEPQTRQVYANQADTLGILKPSGNMFTGKLPDNINIANTSIVWGGKNWAMIMLPLPKNTHDRINLLAHELFHSAQPSLGFTLYNPSNDHLDQKDGRVYLRLEMEALKKAIQSSSDKDLQKHLTSALIFRKYRHMLYPGSDTTENQLELNEGVAEYTGAMIRGSNHKKMQEHFVNGINTFYKNPTFVRSFAYYTTPVYGYLLHQMDNNWQKELTKDTDLTHYFIEAFNLHIPDNLVKAVKKRFKVYNGEKVAQVEKEREDKRKKLVAEYKSKFVEQPHFDIKFEQMNVTFDPRNIMPLEDKGTIYPNIRVTDLWGILEVEDGALMSPNWDKISLTAPINMEGKEITGAGWSLNLTDNYRIAKDETTGNFTLVKK